ncbi:hypothetical protein [Dactylosporangium sp. NPDC050588]|uniref:hypothetical protein n=1 Tax=Dactylosporangium sp. NPDC050588 TaxID=3157211 RepID=UPI003409522E
MTGALVLERYRRIHPDASVLVLDRSTAAAGATGRSAGVCVPLGGVPGRTPLVGPAQAYFAGAARWRETGLVRPLEVWFVLRRHNVPAFLDAWQGGPLRPVAAQRVATVRERAGDLRVDPDEAVLASSGDCYAVDAARLTRALLDLHLNGPGSALWEGSEVVAISPEPGAVRVVLASGHAVHARAVAVAAGGWCPVWPGAAPAQPVKRVAALTVDHPGDGLPMLDFIDDELFILPGEAGLTVSFRRESFAVPGAPLDPTVTAADLDEGRRALTRRSPALAAAIVGAHVGHDAYPHDGAPVVTVTAAGRVVDARGMGGSGIRLGPAVADRVVAALTGAFPPPAPPPAAPPPAAPPPAMPWAAAPPPAAPPPAVPTASAPVPAAVVPTTATPETVRSAATPTVPAATTQTPVGPTTATRGASLPATPAVPAATTLTPVAATVGPTTAAPEASLPATPATTQTPVGPTTATWGASLPATPIAPAAITQSPVAATVRPTTTAPGASLPATPIAPAAITQSPVAATVRPTTTAPGASLPATPIAPAAITQSPVAAAVGPTTAAPGASLPVTPAVPAATAQSPVPSTGAAAGFVVPPPVASAATVAVGIGEVGVGAVGGGAAGIVVGVRDVR